MVARKVLALVFALARDGKNYESRESKSKEAA